MDAVAVLYAEDDENDAFFMERAFRKVKRKSSLQIVTDGMEAVNYLSGAGRYADRRAHPLPKVLVLDINMPRMTGRDVLQWVRQRGEFAALPVVMLTSSTQSTDVEFCEKAGANAYLIKPSQADKLADVMDVLLSACADQFPSGIADRALQIPDNQLTS